MRPQPSLLRLVILPTALAASALGGAGCATLPAMVHNPTAGGFAGEIGPLYGTSGDDESAAVTNDRKEKLKTQEGAGIAALAQFGPVYAKIDAAPLPGMWLGLGLIDPKPGKIGWYPAIEFTGASSQESDEAKDGYLEDDAGNRYLYEIKRTHQGFGLALPQVVEVYPVRRLALYAAAMPAFLNDRSATTVDIVYENDRRLVKADPELDAKFQDIVTYEQRHDDNTNRWLMPLSLGMRFQLKTWHFRLAYVTRRVDSTKNYDSTFRDVAMLTVGYVSGSGGRSFGSSRRPPPPPPAPSGSSTTTTTTTNPDGSTTTTTTTKPAGGR